MNILTIKFENQSLQVNTDLLIGNSTKSLYIRKGFINGALFISRRGNGGGGAGDICRLTDKEVEVNSFILWNSLNVLAEKSKATIN